ncbi:galactose-3-O-sulfotransferase 4-like [Anneissia japonica]|uniref:galactose-3-O-sulfotransferase 4-like n=1 Tax=Anneissia japonica TaxID=1529436 RepID=UPI0014259B08|nr:galactose-3-O-sulfotransferase 4-like [Anneissia japonica]
MSKSGCSMRTRCRYLLALILALLLIFVLFFKDPKPNNTLPVGLEVEDLALAAVAGRGFDGRRAVGAEIWNGQVRNSERENKGQELLETFQKPTADEVQQGGKSKVFEKNSQQYRDQVLCQPKVNITFLKVHKTGSSTLQNIFLRYGDKNNLNFAIPPVGHHLGYPQYFEKKHMIPVANGVYNIYCHHSRFSSQVLEVMPQNAVYVSILREPVVVFESAFTYFKMDGRAGMPGDPAAMSKFLQRPKYFYNKMRSKVHARNVMLYDFGFPEEDFDDESLINKAIKLIDKQFDLVVIAEYFDESLILLKELLCFPLEDIAFFKQNSRKEDSVHQLSDTVKNNVRKWNKGDVMLYDHFNRTLWDKIQAYGVDRMAAEVKELRELNNKLFEKCVATDTAAQGEGEFRIFQPPGVKINTFLLKDSAKEDPLCEQMVKPEIAYTQDLRRKQFPHFKAEHGRKKRLRQPMKKGFAKF